jgi:hypothetical protein
MNWEDPNAMVNKFQPNNIMCLSAICLIIVVRAFDNVDAVVTFGSL